MDQVSSSFVEPSICVACTFARRRYLYAKKMTAAKIRMVITAETAVRKMYSASIRPACADACVGHNGGRSAKTGSRLANMPHLFPFRLRFLLFVVSHQEK